MKMRLLVTAAAAALAFSAPSARAADAETYRQLDLLMEVFERVRAEYVDKVDDKKLLEGAIQGMVSALDPHSSYLDAKDFESMRQTTDGEYGGLGIEVTMEEGVVKVVGYVDDTAPAARAGIKGGDFITHINREPIFGLTLSEAVEKMRGPAKSAITLTVVREGRPQPFDVTMTREVIVARPVRFEARGNVGYIRIGSFNKQTASSLRNAVSTLQKQLGGKLTGFILDLRGNPGGLLDQAIDVSDAFLERGEIVSQRGRRKEDIQRYFARPGDIAAGKPVIVLVNQFSASASEIVAGAIQDQRRGVVIGQRTFGKGSVQTLIPLNADAALRLTTGRYYTPSGRSVQEQGVEPDFEVVQANDPNQQTVSRFAPREADLRNHLVNNRKAGERPEEADVKPDPRQVLSAEDAKKVADFQLDYALKLMRLMASGGSTRVAANP